MNTAESQTDDTLMSVKQTANLIGVSEITLYRWRDNGSGPPFIRLSTARIGYPVGAYRKWVEMQTVGSNPAVHG